VNPDGSCSLVFNGPTDNNGDPTNTALPGPTTFQVKPDGSFEFNHSSIDILADQGSGTLTITTKKDCSIQATGNLVVNCVDANVTATGDLVAQVTGKGTISTGGDCNVTAGGKCVIQATETDVQGSTGMVLTTVTDPVVDTIFGEPTEGVPTFKAG
jgi:hypothetical protein